MNKLAELTKPRLSLSKEEELVGADVPVDGWVITFQKDGKVYRIIRKADLYHERMEEGGANVPKGIIRKARRQMYAIDRDYAQRKNRRTKQAKQLSFF